MSKLKKALERAKKDRDLIGDANGENIHTIPGKTAVAAADDALLDNGKTAEPPQESVSPHYNKTRVVNLDQELIRKNKIISLYGHDQTSDQIKILRTQVLERMKERGGNSLLITSCNPGEGKTLTAINLAVSIAQEVNRTTLLVDADLRKPSIQHMLGFDGEMGLSDYLLGNAELESLFVNPGIEKLTILPAGRPIPDSTELLGAPKMESLVKELKSRYKDRFVIFDTTSLLTRADPIVFSHHIDGIILIVEAERTTAPQLKRTMELLKDKPIIGTLFNKARKL